MGPGSRRDSGEWLVHVVLGGMGRLPGRHGPSPWAAWAVSLALEDGDAVRTGRFSSTKRRHDRAGVQGEGAGQGSSVFAQDGSIVSGGRDDEHDLVHAAVAPLEFRAPLKRLDVTQPGFGVDTDRLASAEQRIPCSQIAVTRNGHLGHPAQTRAEPGAEPRQQAELCGIPHRQPFRIGLQGEPQPKCCAVLCQLIEAWRQALSALCPAHARLRQTCRPGDVRLAQTCGQPRLAQLRAQLGQGRSCLALATVPGSLLDGHRPEGAGRGFTAASPACTVGAWMDGH